MIYLISDTHFNHKNIIVYENRPFNSIPEMNEAIIQRWNEVVSDEDTVIHLGDVGLGCMSELKTIVPRLKGHKILIMGNHDSKSKNFFYECGFEEVVRNKMIEFGDKMIYLSHCPESRPGNGASYDLHFYGHVHTKGMDIFPTISKNGACLCLERWDYKPVLMSDVVDMCNKCDTISTAI